MSVEVNVLEDGDGIEIVAFGAVYGHEITQAIEKIDQDEYLKIHKYRIIDKSKCTEYHVTAGDIEILADKYKKISINNQNLVIAIIEAENLKFSLTELWQAHLKEYPLKIKSFDNRKKALVWVAENI